MEWNLSIFIVVLEELKTKALPLLSDFFGGELKTLILLIYFPIMLYIVYKSSQKHQSLCVVKHNLKWFRVSEYFSNVLHKF